MEYHAFGRTGVEVSRFALGAMAFGWANTDRPSCEAIVHLALDGGVNLFDTADMYANGESERILGAALRDCRDDVVLASKCYWPMSADRNQRGGSRRWIVQAVEQSLKRLGTDRLDVYFLHKPDIATDFEQSLGALSDLVRQGKVVMGGLSSFPGSWIVESHWIAQRRCFEAPRVEQPSYSIVCRGVEEDVLPTTQRLGMGVMTWGPLDGGWLTERNVTGSRPEATGSQLIAERFDTTREPVRRKQHIVTELTGLAAENGLTLPQLATLFCVEHPSVSAVILGPRTPEQLSDLLAVADVRLDRATLDRIDELVPPGTEVDPDPRGWKGPWLSAHARRRPPSA